MTRKTGKRFNGKTSIYAIAGLLMLIVAASVAGSFVWRTQALSSHSAETLERVTIANTAYAATCPVIVAQENGYFEDEGVLVTIESRTSGKGSLDATLRGQADLGTAADVPIMFAVMKGEPVSVIASIFVGERDYGIVARKDRGIVAPADLKGKRVGVTLGAAGHFTLDAFLNRQKMSINDVTTRDLKPEELAGALAKGDIDAASGWEPHLGTMREQLGANATAFSGADVYNTVYNIAGTREYVANHPNTIRKILRAVIRGGAFCEGSPDAASEIVARVIKTDLKILRELWPSFQFNVALDQGLVLALEDETRWAIKNKLTDQSAMPNYLNYLYMDGLLAVAPATVTVIH